MIIGRAGFVMANSASKKSELELRKKVATNRSCRCEISISSNFLNTVKTLWFFDKRKKKKEKIKYSLLMLRNI